MERTELKIKPAERKITRSSRLLLLGSCFTTEVGTLLAADGYHAVINPTGNVYNPLSAARTIANIEQGRRYGESDLIEVQGLWRSLDHHTRLAAPTPAEALRKINASMAEARGRPARRYRHNHHLRHRLRIRARRRSRLQLP